MVGGWNATTKVINKLKEPKITFDNVNVKPKLIIHLFETNKKNDGNLYYHINNNPNVSKDMPLLLKDKNFSSIEIMYDGDDKQNLILDKFKEYYKIGA